MSYSTQVDSPPKTQSSLINDGQQLDNRLGEILSRIDKIGDALHGSEPRDAGVSAPQPTASNLRRVVDAAHELASRIESALNRVEARL